VPGLGAGGVTAPVATEVDMAKRQARLDAEGVEMLLQEGLQLLVGRRGPLGGLLGEELQLLPQAAADDGVVAVQAHGYGLAVQHLLADIIVDQPCQLLCRGQALPGAREADQQMLEMARRDHDVARPFTAAVTDHGEDPKQHGS